MGLCVGVNGVGDVDVVGGARVVVLGGAGVVDVCCRRCC